MSTRYIALRAEGSWVICDETDDGAMRSYLGHRQPDGSWDMRYRPGIEPEMGWKRWVPSGILTPERHGKVYHLYDTPGKASGRAGKFGKVAEVDLETLIPMDASPQEKLEHYEKMMLKYGAKMEALLKEISDDRSDS